METIIVIHGFGSSGESSSTCRLIQERFPEHRVIAPSFNSAMLETAAEDLVAEINSELSDEDENLFFVGVSLGGYFARYLANNSLELFGKPCFDLVLLNPSLDAPENLKTRIGTNKNHATGEMFCVSSMQVQSLERFKIETDREGLAIYLMVAANDDVVDPSFALEIFRDRAHCWKLPKGGHRLSDAESRRLVCSFIQDAINTVAG